ncbi:hypothetical protein [Microlunatus speluncae]|uniref:hypothetical protein n=1 Tax=Microlunatus speluncae TaxID=2594267 RepID=UPI00126687AC|nr:hypothetical protein [Microlunatus speluncae]
MAKLDSDRSTVRAEAWWHRAAGVSSRSWRIAHLITLLTLPSALWRLGIAAGIDWPGYDLAWITRSRLDTPFGAFRMVLLSLISELLALLALGLVQRWGEVVPPWIPVLRGRVINRWLPTLLAITGGAGLIMVWTFGVPYAAITGTAFDAGMDRGFPLTVQLISYAPMVLWGPCLLLLAISYLRRRRCGVGALSPEPAGTGRRW